MLVFGVIVMKNKKIAIIVTLVFITALFVVSCQLKSPQIPGNKETVSPAKLMIPDLEWITLDDSIDYSGMNLYSRSEVNIHLPGDYDPMLSLYVHADKGDDGEFGFDDGQDWMLIMETSFGNFPLFPRQRIQLGSVGYKTFYEYGDNEYDIFHVLVTIDMSAGHEIYDCIFDKEKNAFKVVTVYSILNINSVGRSR